MKLGRMVRVLTVLALLALAAVPATNALSAASPSKPEAVRVRVLPADLYCTSGTGTGLLMPCQRGHHWRFHLGGPHNQWLVIFSFIAPRSTAAYGRVLYFFTVYGPGRCPTAGQFGTYNQGAVRKSQRVVNWATFGKDCPGPGHGTISLIKGRGRPPFPIRPAGRLVARFKFTIP